MQMRTVLPYVVAAVLALGYLALAKENQYQRHLVFLPTTRMTLTPWDRSLNYTEQWIDAPAAGGVGGGLVHGWWLPGDSPQTPALLYLHGNDDTISTSIDAIARFRQLGFAVLAIDYRGYGSSMHALPEEYSAYADAQAAWNRLMVLAPQARKRLIYGHSLGSAIAVELASREPRVDQLVVEGSFTSVVDVGDTTPLSWLPLSLIVTQRFSSADKVGKLRMPKLFIHCSADEVIPLSLGQRLYQLAAPPKTLLVIAGGDHEDCAAFGAQTWQQAMRRAGGFGPGIR